MSTLAVEPLALRVEFDADTMWLDLADGRRLGVPLAYFPRLLRATPVQRNNYVISGGGTGLHWEDLDEDILVSALLLGVRDRTRSAQHDVLVARDRKADDTV
jgi:hypothetical protein